VCFPFKKCFPPKTIYFIYILYYLPYTNVTLNILYNSSTNEHATIPYITAATARHQATKPRSMMPTIETPTAMNHLFLTKQNMRGRNRYIAAGPRIANIYPNLSPTANTHKPGAAKRIQVISVVYLVDECERGLSASLFNSTLAPFSFTNRMTLYSLLIIPYINYQ